MRYKGGGLEDLPLLLSGEPMQPKSVRFDEIRRKSVGQQSSGVWAEALTTAGLPVVVVQCGGRSRPHCGVRGDVDGSGKWHDHRPCGGTGCERAALSRRYSCQECWQA